MLVLLGFATDIHTGFALILPNRFKKEAASPGEYDWLITVMPMWHQPV